MQLVLHVFICGYVVEAFLGLHVSVAYAARAIIVGYHMYTSRL